MPGYLFYFNYYKYNTILLLVKLYKKNFKKFVICFTHRSKTAVFTLSECFLPPVGDFGVLTGRSVSVSVAAGCVMWQAGRRLISVPRPETFGGKGK
jgi:hypothetical protein